MKTFLAWSIDSFVGNFSLLHRRVQGHALLGVWQRLGSLELLKWANSIGCPLSNTNACTEASYEGNLEILKWLRAHGCPWDDSACVVAARRGNLDILIWLRENNCPWSKTCEFAARSGQLNVLKWARENGWVRHLAKRQLREGNWRCWSGWRSKTALGQILPRLLPREET